MTELTQDLLKELFDYRDGELYWKVARGCVKIGDRAGTDLKGGYRGIRINGKLYKAHRLIFLYHHGYLPKFLDHIDRNPSNNNISNLRDATMSQNGMNRKKVKSHNGKPTTSKFKGVYWNKRREKWQVRIQINGKRKHFGYYDSKIEAAKTSDKALIKRDGEFAVTNKSLGYYNDDKMR